MKTLENYSFILLESAKSSSDDYDNVKGVICELCDTAEKAVKGKTISLRRNLYV